MHHIAHMHLLSHFWIAYAFVRHPIAAGAAILISIVVGYAIVRFRRPS